MISETLSLTAIVIGSFRTESNRVKPNDLGGSAGGRAFLNKLNMCVPSTESLWNVKLGTWRHRHPKSLAKLKKRRHNSQHPHNLSLSLKKTPHWQIENKSLLTESLKWQDLAAVPTILHWNVTSCHFLLSCVHANVYKISAAAADEEMNNCSS